MNTLFYRKGNNAFAFSRGRTSNKKIAAKNELIVQTSTYSAEQYALVHSGVQHTMTEFFLLDKSNCLDCPFSGSNRHLSNHPKCYTHKYMQYHAMLRQIRSAVKQYGAFENLPQLTDELSDELVRRCEGLFIRFGTYGEPSLLPMSLVARMVSVCKSHTGYTHQSKKKWAMGYGRYFMASVESNDNATPGWRSFIVRNESDPVSDAVHCPASKERGMISNCSKCGLCSGTLGKGKKNVSINLH